MLSRNVANSSRLLKKVELRALARTASCAGIRPTARFLTTITPSLQNTTGETQNDIPWYLREDESSQLDTPIFKAVMPEIPANSPQSLKPTLEYMIKDLGLDGFEIFDIRDREDLPISTSSDFMVICEGKSEKHIQNASQELITFLKQQYDVYPYVEGLIKPNSMARMRRRMKRRLVNRRQSSTEDFGVGPNSWVMLDTQIDSIYIHILTPERRSQVNLEYMWCKPEDREKYQTSTTERSNGFMENDDNIFSSIYKRYYSTERQFELDNLALQQLKVGDVEGFDAIAGKIRSDNEISTKILAGIITDLQTSSLTDVVEDGATLHQEFFHKSFPLVPSQENWNQRFKFLSLIHLILPKKVTIEDVVDSLYLQSQSGYPIKKENILEFLNVINRSPTYHDSNIVKTTKQINLENQERFKILSNLLKIFDVNHKGSIDNQLKLELLRFSSQQINFNNNKEEVIPLPGNFKVLVKLLSNNNDSFDIIQFILTAYLKANDTYSFYSYWKSQYSYRLDKSDVVIDNRPWGILFELLETNNKDNFNELFVHEELPKLLDSEVPLTTEHKSQILSILNNFDESGENYKDIRSKL